MVQITRQRGKLSEQQVDALDAFKKLGISVHDFLTVFRKEIQVTTLEPCNRELHIMWLPPDIAKVTRDDIRWVLHRYLHGKTSGEELSNWAGLLLTIDSFSLPTSAEDDDLLQLLADLALPLKEEYLDRDRLRDRIAEI